jgi:hypothetical protein
LFLDLNRQNVENRVKNIENSFLDIGRRVRALFEKILRLCSNNRMKLDSNLFKTIKNGKFDMSCQFGGHFVNLTFYSQKIVEMFTMV